MILLLTTTTLYLQPAQYLGEFGCNVEVHRNDKISVEQHRAETERLSFLPVAARKPESR